MKLHVLLSLFAFVATAPSEDYLGAVPRANEPEAKVVETNIKSAATLKDAVEEMKTAYEIFEDPNLISINFLQAFEAKYQENWKLIMYDGTKPNVISDKDYQYLSLKAKKSENDPETFYYIFSCKAA